MPRTAIVLSDTHLGTARSDGDALVSFLRSLRPGASRLRLILAGDIVDLWRMSDEEAAKAAMAAFGEIDALLDGGALVDWVLGNHDHHLLRSLDGQGSPVLDVTPRGIRFHHPHRRLVQRGRVFVVTHGDVCDFLHLPLEGFGPLSAVLEPRDVYAFYDWVYGLDTEFVAAFDRLGTRGLLLAWIAERWADLWEALRGLSGDERPADAAGRAQVAGRMSEAFDFDPVDVAEAAERLDLGSVWQRVATSLTWRRMRYASPHPKRVSRRRFAGADEIVCGHFHLLRREAAEGWAVTDVGAWWDGPGAGGTYARIVDGAVTLERWP